MGLLMRPIARVGIPAVVQQIVFLSDLAALLCALLEVVPDRLALFR